MTSTDAKIRFDETVSRTDRNNLRNAYRIMLENGYERAEAREWVAERLAEIA